jgi:NADH-quinone oxidoreductase subunit N
VKGPSIDWAALSPLIALAGGACVVLLVGLLRSGFARRHVTAGLTLVTLAATAGLGVWQWGVNTEIIEATLAIDDLTLALTMLFVVGGAAAVLMSWRGLATREAGEGEYYALLLSSILGMVVLVAAQNLVVVFVGFELLSIPLYVLCATHMRREHSLESGLKYLIIGSVGSATLLYGLSLLYGATGSTDYAGIAAAAGDLDGDVLFLTAIALIVAGLAFKASVAPFHQWTPDVYEGAPTPVTGFMAVATKAAAFGVLVRLFDVALIDAASTWGPAFAVLAVVTIVVGNVGAIGQSSLKRMLAYSSVAQAGYMLVGVVVSTKLGVQATIFYLAGYTAMNLAAFAVITARERESGAEDDISSLYGLGAERPWLAWPMTIAMLALAGFPATVGFFGKLYLIRAALGRGGDMAFIGRAAESSPPYSRLVSACPASRATSNSGLG